MTDGTQVASTATDMYMFGCFMLEVLSGCVPWHWLGSDEALVFQRMRSPATSPLDAPDADWRFHICDDNPDVPATLDDVLALVRACLSENPADRPSAASLAETLRNWTTSPKPFTHMGYGGVAEPPGKAAPTADAADTAGSAGESVCSEADALAAVAKVKAYAVSRFAEVVPLRELVGMVDAVAGWMTSSEDVAWEACDALLRVCINNPTNIRAITCDSDALKRVIFPGMDAHVTSERVQREACGALWYMLDYSIDQSIAPADTRVEGLNERVKEAIRGSGGVDRVARAKENHGYLKGWPEHVIAELR